MRYTGWRPPLQGGGQVTGRGSQAGRPSPRDTGDARNCDISVTINIYLFMTIPSSIMLAIMTDANDHRAAEKWGDAALAGFQQVPDILLKKQVELGLSPTDMLVLLNITMHWWYAGQRPFPRPTTIADRLNVAPRTVQRSLRRLSELGLVERVTEPGEDGTPRLVCDLSGLVTKLERYARADPNYRVRAKGRDGKVEDQDRDAMAM